MFWRYLQAGIYWVSYLVFPLLVYFVWRLLEEPGSWLIMTGILLALVFIYARFVEPYWLKVRTEKYSHAGGKIAVRILLLSDPHFGVFRKKRFFEKVFAKIRELKPDLILIPGDLINDPSEAELKEIFKPLAKLGAPVYAVTGNHDSKKPGYYISERVREELEAVGVKAMDNLVEVVSVKGVKINLLGMSDLMEGEHDWRVLWQERDRKHFNLLLAHNPDMAHEIVAGSPVDMVLSGHTHDGQIKLPPISTWLIPTVHKFHHGWHQINGRPVYVSSGLGEVILPMRFLIRPEIVVMDLTL